MSPTRLHRTTTTGVSGSRCPSAARPRSRSARKWQERPYDPAQFDGNSQNVGIQLGEQSGAGYGKIFFVQAPGPTLTSGQFAVRTMPRGDAHVAEDAPGPGDHRATSSAGVSYNGRLIFGAAGAAHAREYCGTRCRWGNARGKRR